MKVWAKLMKNDKILRDIIFEGNYELTEKDFIAMCQEISYKLEIATPVILSAHLEHFDKFNRVKFLPRDFIDEVEFTSFILERVRDEKQKPKGYYM